MLKAIPVAVIRHSLAAVSGLGNSLALNTGSELRMTVFLLPDQVYSIGRALIRFYDRYTISSDRSRHKMVRVQMSAIRPLNFREIPVVRLNNQ